MRFLLAALVGVSHAQKTAAPTEVKASVDARQNLIAVCPQVSAQCGVPTGLTAAPKDLATALDCMLKVDLSRIPKGPCYDTMRAFLVNHNVPVHDNVSSQPPRQAPPMRGPPNMMPPFIGQNGPIPNGFSSWTHETILNVPPMMRGPPNGRPSVPPPRDSDKPWDRKSDDHKPQHGDHKPPMSKPIDHHRPQSDDRRPPMPKPFDHRRPEDNHKPWDRDSKDDKHSKSPKPWDRDSKDDKHSKSSDRDSKDDKHSKKHSKPSDRDSKDNKHSKPSDRENKDSKHSMPQEHKPRHSDDSRKPSEGKDVHRVSPREDAHPAPRQSAHQDDDDDDSKHAGPFFMSHSSKRSYGPQGGDDDDDDDSKHAGPFFMSHSSKRSYGPQGGDDDDDDSKHAGPFFMSHSSKRSYGRPSQGYGRPSFPFMSHSSKRSYGTHGSDDDRRPSFSMWRQGGADDSKRPPFPFFMNGDDSRSSHSSWTQNRMGGSPFSKWHHSDDNENRRSFSFPRSPFHGSDKHSSFPFSSRYGSHDQRPSFHSSSMWHHGNDRSSSSRPSFSMFDRRPSFPFYGRNTMRAPFSMGGDDRFSFSSQMSQNRPSMPPPMFFNHYGSQQMSGAGPSPMFFQMMQQQAPMPIPQGFTRSTPSPSLDLSAVIKALMASHAAAAQTAQAAPTQSSVEVVPVKAPAPASSSVEIAAPQQQTREASKQGAPPKDQVSYRSAP